MADASEVLDYLTELESRVVHLRDVDGMKWAEIGHELNMDRRNAQHAHQRAHSKMAQHGPAPSREYRRALEEAREEAFPSLIGSEIANKLLSTKIEKGIWTALWRMLNDPAPLDRTSVKKLASVWGQMIDRRQLLPGEPRQMIKIWDIRKLDKELVLLIKQMERRCWLVDFTPKPIADVLVESASSGGPNGAS